MAYVVSEPRSATHVDVYYLSEQTGQPFVAQTGHRIENSDTKLQKDSSKLELNVSAEDECRVPNSIYRLPSPYP